MPPGDPSGLSPYLVVSDAVAAIEFYNQAFGAKEVARHTAPNSTKIMHARMDVFGSILMFADDFPEMMGGKHARRRRSVARRSRSISSSKTPKQSGTRPSPPERASSCH